jgi:hypothetical protein
MKPGAYEVLSGIGAGGMGEGRFAYHTNGSYDVTPDGQRFVLIDDSEAEPAPTHLVLVQNFSEVLKRLVPPN